MVFSVWLYYLIMEEKKRIVIVGGGVVGMVSRYEGWLREVL